MPLPIGRIIDISLELNAKNFRMQVMEGFKRDMQFEVEVIKFVTENFRDLRRRIALDQVVADEVQDADE